MRTYQRVNASNGFDAVGNMLVVGTAFIWVPVLAVLIGYEIVSGKIERSKKEQAAVHAAQVQRAYEQSPEGKLAAEVKRKAAEDAEFARRMEKADYDFRLAQGVADFHKLKISGFDVSDRYNLKPTWEISKGRYTYTLTDETCRYAGTTDRKLGFRKALWSEGKTSMQTGACYQVRGDVVYVFDMNRGVHFLREDVRLL